uniref:Uncharacterized protein n=1 Tax=Gasterosteus aculeatus TaxID=69293 RepID=G3NZ40_GASAC
KCGRKSRISVPTSSFTTATRGTPSSSSWGFREDSPEASCSGRERERERERERRRSASSRFSSDALAALGRQRSVLAKKIPASAAPTAPRPSDHIPIPNSPPSSSDTEDSTAARREMCQSSHTCS